MTLPKVKDLFKLSIIDPHRACRQVIDLNIPIQALWIGLALLAVTLSLVASGILHMVPLPPENPNSAEVQALLHYTSPFFAALLQWGQMMISIFILFWVGLALGGTGTLADVLAGIVWMNIAVIILGFYVIFIGFLLAFIAPILVVVAACAMVAWALWATCAMIHAAHRFDSYFKSTAVFIIATLVLMFIMDGITSSLGLTGAGVSLDV